VHDVASETAEAAARTAKRIANADTRLAGVVSKTTKNTLTATIAAAKANAINLGVKVLDAATPKKDVFKKVGINIAKVVTGVDAKIKTKEAERIAAKGAKRVKRAMAKNADSKSDALEDAAESAAHAAKRAAIKAEIAEKRAKMGVMKAASSVLKS
jgi:hypothetical protein